MERHLMGVMMGDFLAGAFVGSSTMLLVIIIFEFNSPPTTKQEAFDRGYMVECLGVYGYYWECDDE